LLGEQRHMCVNNLPKVITWQCSDSDSNLQPQGYKFGPTNTLALTKICQIQLTGILETPAQD